MKKTISLVTNNPIGGLVGGVAGWMASSKLLKLENMWLKVGVAVVGAYIGSTLQSNMKAKGGVPTAETVKK